MINHANEVSNLIKQKRTELNLSQTDLSRLIGFSSTNGQFVSNIERGRCQFPVKMVKKLSEVLMVSEETIIELMTLDYKKSLMSEVLNGTSSISDETINQL